MHSVADEGWVKIHRKIMDNPIFKDAKTLQLFLYLLLKASHKPERFPFNRGEITLERGQLLTGRNRIREDTKLSDREIRTRLELLKNLQIVTIKTTNRFSIITICNYNLYQDTQGKDRPAERPTNDQQTTTYKNSRIKEIKNNGRLKEQTDPRVKEFFDYWGESFLQQIGQPYTFSFGKEGTLVKSLLQIHEIDILLDLTRQFFQDEQ